jgi:hypothetical protein
MEVDTAEEGRRRLKAAGLIESRQVRQLRKGQVVLLRPEGHPCKIDDMTTAKMLAPSSGRYADGSADYYCGKLLISLSIRLRVLFTCFS